MRKSNIVESFNYAIEGFIYVLKTQRNMRVHFLLAVFIFVIGIVLGFTRIELVCLSSAITMVLAAEMVNTIVEHTIDLISDVFHPLARIIKDISAGVVLLTSASSAIIGYLLFSRHLTFSLGKGISRLKNSPAHISVVALIVVLALSVLGKVLFRSGTPLRGGMPSGHSALAFAMWTIILFSTSNPLIIVLTFVMAGAIARSRYKEGIHTWWEVAAGALVGLFTTFLLIQIFFK